MKKMFFMLLLLSFVCGCSTISQDKKEGVTQSSVPFSLVLVENQLKKDMEAKGIPYVDNTSVINAMGGISNKLGSFVSNGRHMNYEPIIKGMGYSKSYYSKNNSNMVATVYTYNLLMSEIPDGISSQEINKAYIFTLAEIKATEGKIFSGINKVEDRELLIKGADKKLPFKKYSFRAKNLEVNENVVSNAFITAYMNTIIKVRFTYLASAEKIGEEKMNEFMSDLVANLADFDGDVFSYEKYKSSKNAK